MRPRPSSPSSRPSSLYLYALAAGPHRPMRGGAVAALAMRRPRRERRAEHRHGAGRRRRCAGAASRRGRGEPRRAAGWLAVGAALGAAAATVLGAWAQPARPPSTARRRSALARAFAWFAWPAWLLALWTVWRWRRRLAQSPHRRATCARRRPARHLARDGRLGSRPDARRCRRSPCSRRSRCRRCSGARRRRRLVLGVLLHHRRGDRLGLLRRDADRHAGQARGERRQAVDRLPDATSRPSALLFAVAGTLAWLWLVRWRTGRSRHPLWKSLVLPAGGVGLCWLLVMTLLLPPLDNARSYRSMVQRIATQVPATACVAAPDMPRAEVVALEYLGGYRVDAVTPVRAAVAPTCCWSRRSRRRAHPGRCSAGNVAIAATTTSPTSTAATRRLTG